MSDTIQRQLLSALLDKYERSIFFREGIHPTRRIMLKLYDNGQSDFPQYNIEQSEKRILANRAVLAMAEKRLVFYQWMKGEENHIIAQIWLNLENLPMAYEFAGRQPKNEKIDDVCFEILDVLDKVKVLWARQYLQDLYETISRKRDLGNRLPEAEDERKELFRAIQFIDGMGDSEVLERVFSLQCFGDSKQFERTVKSRLLSVLRKYLDTEEDARDEELLRQIGIVKYPEQFEFCGDVKLSFACGTVDFSYLRYGGNVCSADLLRGNLVITSGVERILSIENRANYIDYIYKHKVDNELVIYHGGQYSPSKKKFFHAVAKAMPTNCGWSHWGDIDYGGFSMLARLRREITQDISAYRMNVQELKRYSNLTASVTHAYAEKVKSLGLRSELNDCKECLDYMVSNRKKLEQEAMLTDTE
ncbi:Wadjet anti-phage system protein JetD domain-containing protein [Desulfitobacterium chlororespirans]|uniref:Wadjet protein JetD C-terminal domain-containing protein n=1 Tax=Desulfitobacterium chlororespirans DSM 11544 TaxID=1121395 RepID=A0A1M7RVX1_9FIRM|nr:Wadjet anti-phage system protein JetD domain-containing protein [Desulfitobacterium chlororespirans]SHN50370.1 hypothetical protein SAMN02745215_00173 [Desulfitobacterium chlororespirans DSM 11544]